MPGYISCFVSQGRCHGNQANAQGNSSTPLYAWFALCGVRRRAHCGLPYDELTMPNQRGVPDSLRSRIGQEQTAAQGTPGNVSRGEKLPGVHGSPRMSHWALSCRIIVSEISSLPASKVASPRLRGMEPLGQDKLFSVSAGVPAKAPRHRV